MRTKIIYISGSEIFSLTDIRSAFEEVRNTLNLDKDTVLFGVPVDADDAALCTQTEVQQEVQIEEPLNIEIDTSIEEPQEVIVPIETPIQKDQEKTPLKKRGRHSKPIIETDIEVKTENIENEASEEKVVPILTVLSNKDPIETEKEIIIPTENIAEEEQEAITEEPNTIENDIYSIEDKDIENLSEEPTESNLEALLDTMPPLQEDKDEVISQEETIVNAAIEHDDVDITLEQLANEFAENQDKIKTANKGSVKNKISKLKNILPFRQTKHKDQNDGDLFGWAGVAANDEEFSVPGFFTSMTAKK